MAFGVRQAEPSRSRSSASHGVVGHTSGGTAKQVKTAVQTALIPFCVKDVMADAAAIAELKVKRVTDYDDVVRDYRKRTGALTDMGFQFNRDCGKAIEAAMAKSATKS